MVFAMGLKIRLLAAFHWAAPNSRKSVLIKLAIMFKLPLVDSKQDHNFASSFFDHIER